jgi:signal transduction histidine kinase
VTTNVSAHRTRRWQLPRIDPDERWLGGVAAGIAREIGVQPLVIRLSFGVLALAAGWGVVFYVAAWVGLAVAQPNQLAPYQPQPKAASATHRNVAVAMIVLGLLLALRDFHFFLFKDEVVFPAGFVLTGFLIAWTRHQQEAGLSAVVRIMAGVTVGVGGIIAFVFVSANLVDATLVLLIAIAVIAGIGLVAAPSLARIGHDLDNERQNRVRADERALVAAHLHDSVLQTLALIQRHADDPTKTAQLARQQERELRHWLYGFPGQPTEAGGVRLGSALDDMGAEVDAAHGVAVKVITAGDNSDLAAEVVEPLVAAAREAVVNAAKHSGANRVDVFAERSSDRIEIFIRDTGRGFDPQATAQDRRGLAESIIGRMRRAGGQATITSEPGAGTEVELVLPLPTIKESSHDPSGAGR